MNDAPVPPELPQSERSSVWCTTPENVLSSWSSADWSPRSCGSLTVRHHAGTTDVDVQVDLEVAAGAVNTERLEQALRNAEFVPDHQRTWRWIADGIDTGTVIKFELLVDLDDQR